MASFSALAGGCIDVGHAAEVGCLVDMDEPGCRLPGLDASAVDGGRAGADALGEGRSSASEGATEGADPLPESGAQDRDVGTIQSLAKESH
jgi:hypothetical protein